MRCPQCITLAIVISFLAGYPIQAAQESSDLNEVVARAAKYVKEYEAKLGTLIGVEEYTQSSAWKTAGGRSMIARRQQRRLSSDFLILQVGPEWIGVRNVNRQDGQTVKKKIEEFQQIFDDSPAAILKTLQSLADDSARFNIGDIQRNINLPTFALLVLREQFLSEFLFEKQGEDRIDGTNTWRISFRELRGPTLVQGPHQEDQFSYGVLWIEPESGRILKTELNIGGRGSGLPYHARMIAAYSFDEKLGMLLPRSMIERYESDHNIVDCRADYSKFIRFEVDVKFDITTPPTKKQ